MNLYSEARVWAAVGCHSANNAIRRDAALICVNPRSSVEALCVLARLVRANTVKPIPASALKADFVNAEQVAAIGQEETSGVY